MTWTGLKAGIGKLSVWKVLVGAFLALALIGQGISLYERVVPKPAAPAPVVQVNDSTQAQMAQLRREKAELLALVDAARAMRGSLVAGLQITVRADTLRGGLIGAPTSLGADSTRYATRTDSAKGYRITVRGEAPPTGDLKLGYEITTPEFRPQVGFVKKDGNYYGVVSWAGQTFTTSNSFYTPAKDRAFSLHAGATVKGAPADNAMGISGRGDIYGAVQYRLRSYETQLRLGHDGSPYLGLNVEKKLW